MTLSDQILSAIDLALVFGNALCGAYSHIRGDYIGMGFAAAGMFVGAVAWAVIGR